jgi:hypothetical protein
MGMARWSNAVTRDQVCQHDCGLHMGLPFTTWLSCKLYTKRWYHHRHGYSCVIIFLISNLYVESLCNFSSYASRTVVIPCFCHDMLFLNKKRWVEFRLFLFYLIPCDPMPLVLVVLYCCCWYWCTLCCDRWWFLIYEALSPLYVTSWSYLLGVGSATG